MMNGKEWYKLFSISRIITYKFYHRKSNDYVINN